MMKYPIEFDPTALSLLGPLIKESVIAVGRKKEKKILILWAWKDARKASHSFPEKNVGFSGCLELNWSECRVYLL